MEVRRIRTPLIDSEIEQLRAGDQVMLSGIIYTARDAAHARMVARLSQGRSLPFDIRGQVIYYVGPTPARPGQVIGAAGPTSSYRMDAFTPQLLEHGLKGMIGKGQRTPAVKEAIAMHRSVYFAAIGGAGALLSKSIKQLEVIAYEDLGAEAIYKLHVESLPAIVINDIYGNDLYENVQRGTVGDE